MENIVSYKYPFKQKWQEQGAQELESETQKDFLLTIDKMISHHKSEISKIEFIMKNDFETNASGNSKLTSDLENHVVRLEKLTQLKATVLSVE